MRLQEYRFYQLSGSAFDPTAIDLASGNCANAIGGLFSLQNEREPLLL